MCNLAVGCLTRAAWAGALLPRLLGCLELLGLAELLMDAVIAVG